VKQFEQPMPRPTKKAKSKPPKSQPLDHSNGQSAESNVALAEPPIAVSEPQPDEQPQSRENAPTAREAAPPVKSDKNDPPTAIFSLKKLQRARRGTRTALPRP